ncbi:MULTISPECIES: TRAP transporter substrate-binding protein [Pseudomonas]|uniref:TRAP transporter substrate-binding protein n=1 Tax=Pseudomonas spirodelae TaxID=3101751 RepID=A0ABU5P9M2_9PSED|nr:MULTISPECIES: TRAP transporter substrate-binding protein [unclassified Pseudomonas]MBU0902952.1 TRAP transporter substrate-binding protein [Gammaproteobacteria bacterium]MDD2160962.1 TRAP transporter substrate-binding protein [Pseudomonas sp. MIL19]MEA1606367.1 TRAP transporter substrate-binding protein [Pseudomonas sp. T5W1]
MIRRPLLLASALLAALGLSGCKEEAATSQAAATTAAAGSPAAENFQWKMVTAWPKNYPGLGTSAERLAERVKTMSNGRLTIKVYAGGELVPPLEVFDAVSRGTAELGHGAAYYWKGKVPAAQFFTAVPFGLSTPEMNAWLSKGGGQALWEEAYAPHGVKPLAVGNTGMQMGGWYNKEINSLDDLKGLKIRMPGLGGEVLSKLGATTVNLPGGEVFTALQTNAIDATDWVSPYNDLAFGLHKAAKFYYYPGWQEPQAVLELLINQKAFDSLPADLQAILTEATRAANQDMLDDYVYNNALALDQLKQQGTLLKRFPDEVLAAMQHESTVVLGELAGQNELNGRIWASMQAFQAQASLMHQLSEKELYNWR